MLPRLLSQADWDAGRCDQGGKGSAKYFREFTESDIQRNRGLHGTRRETARTLPRHGPRKVYTSVGSRTPRRPLAGRITARAPRLHADVRARYGSVVEMTIVSVRLAMPESCAAV